LVVIHVIAIFSFLLVGETLAHTPHDVIRALDISPAYQADQTLFVIVHDRLQKSTDGGNSWKQLSRGLDNRRSFSSIVISPSFPSDKTLFLSSEGDGIYRSIDGGLSWYKINMGLAHLKIRLLAISPAYSSDKILLALGTAGELYRTQDRGETWHQLLGANVKVTAMAFSPAMDTTRIFIGDEKGGVYASTDSGDTWEQQFRLSNEDAITCIVVSANSSSDATIFLGTKGSGVLKKAVGAGPYVAVNDGLFEPTAQSGEYVTSLILSPYYPLDPTVFASTWYSGVFRSDNGGKTWKKYSNGLTSDRQADNARFKSPHFSGLRISQSFPKDKTIFLAGYDGLFKSTDGGNLWLELQTLSKQLIKALALSPRYNDDSTIAISTFFGGAYLSTDRGITWQSINGGLHDSHLIDIAFSPNFRSDDALLSISNSSFNRTTSQQRTWEPIRLGYYGWRRSLSTVLSRMGLPRMALLSESEKELTFPVVAIRVNLS
jgi:photosystem II stability/assembly factor-like uncharacterized protein